MSDGDEEIRRLVARAEATVTVDDRLRAQDALVKALLAEREAMVDALDRYGHASGTGGAMPLSGIVQSIARDWARQADESFRRSLEELKELDAEDDERYARLKKEHDRVLDILLHAISGETTAHEAEEPKDIASLAAATLREFGARVAVMDKRIEADPHYRSRVEAYERLLTRIPEWHERWMPTQHRKNDIAREAKNVLLGITSARAAGFPLGALEERVMALIEAERTAS